MSIRPNTTCDVYRSGNAPPSAPDVAGVPCCFVSCFDQGREHGEKEAQQFRFTAKMLVAPTSDVRDNFSAWAGSASSRDTVYVPDWTGIGYNVNFVERINRGLASDALCVYLDRLAVVWPYPGPAVLEVSPNFGPLTGGTSITLSGRGFTGASAVYFGSTAATSFTVNADARITAVSPAESAGQIDVTVTTPLGTSSANVSDEFTFEATVATPTFSPAAGTYTAAQSVSISCSTSGSTIYYTTDGSTPTTSSTQYTSSVSVNNPETLKAIAVHSGDITSAVGSAAYAFQCATPSFSPAAGAYGPSQTVTISSSSGATIYYTTDGSTPTSSSTQYTGALTVSLTETIKAIAEEAGYSNSSIASATYTLGGSMTYTTPGSYTWTAPAGVTSVTAACWGGGQGGSNGALAPGTGGDGAYYEYNSSVAVTAGNSYTVVVASGGPSGGIYGENSTFTGDSVTVTGYGGAAPGGTGTYSGGFGASAGTSTGGGGGSSAGTSSDGNNGASGSLGGAGGAAVTGGGAGGNGSSTTANGSTGSTPGGGGGGGSGQGPSVGGTGGSGQVILTWA